MSDNKTDKIMSDLRLSLRAGSAEYFNRAQLSEEKLELFESLLGKAKSEQQDNQKESASSSFKFEEERAISSHQEPQSGRLPAKLKWIGVVASLLLFVGIIVSQTSTNLPLAIANEVAMNHIKMKPLEVRSQNLNALRGYFTELDFSVTSSKEFGLPQSGLLGGRYCSIQGVSAAQIRYLDSSRNGKVTLYQVGYDKALYGELPNVEKGDKPKVMLVKGIKVRLWVEKGLLMAEASQG